MAAKSQGLLANNKGRQGWGGEVGAQSKAAGPIPPNLSEKSPACIADIYMTTQVPQVGSNGETGG